MTALATVVALGVLFAMSFVLGRALLVIARAPELRGLEPAFGLSLLLVVAVLGVRLPGHGSTGAVLLATIAIAAVWFARRDLTLPTRGALGAGAIVAVAVGLPFVTQGRFGILGVSILEDIGSHYVLADSLRMGVKLPLEANLSSYPIAPHALAGSLVSLLGSDDPSIFTALMMTTAIASAFAAATALWRSPAPLAAIGGAAAGFGFLPAAYYGQSAFKEMLVAMLVLAFAVALERLAEAGAWRRGAVALLGLPAAAALGAFGAPGPAWLVGTVGLFVVATAIAARRRPGRESLRRLAMLVAAPVAVLVVASLPQIDRLVSFNAATNAVGGTDPKQFTGNLVGFLPLREVLGVWPGGDFRLGPTELGTTAVGLVALVLAVGLVAALVSDARRRRFAIGSALVTAVVIYLVNRRTQGPYVTAKTMVILAPLAATVLLRWLFAARSGALRTTAWAAGLAAVGLMFWSTSLSLRTLPVGPLNQALELRDLRSAIGDRAVLFIGYDNFISWELAGERVAMVAPYSVQPSVPVELRPEKPVGRFAPVDADSVTPTTLARAPLAITTGAGYASRLAGSWRPIRTAGLFTLWERNGAVPDKRLLDESTGPGSRLKCRRGVPSIPPSAQALVLSDPVIGPANAWLSLSGAPAALDGGGSAAVPGGETVQQALALDAGEWDLSLQYAGSQTIRVRAAGLDRTLPANLVASGAMWPVGTISADGPSTIYITVASKPLLARAAGASIGPIVATRRGGDRTMAASAACGRYLDGYLAR